MMEITSFSNPLVKRIKRLQRKKHRQKEGVFYIDGLPQVLTAIEHRASIEVVMFCEKLLTSEAGWLAIAQQRAKGVPCTALSEDIFHRISHLNTRLGHCYHTDRKSIRNHPDARCCFITQCLDCCELDPLRTQTHWSKTSTLSYLASAT
ncbi:hypothetical protein IH992_31735 [Candidatus Poribacteria bacterium]|nr:hypothetical protein [Candidatus Poribacteria bacterium]